MPELPEVETIRRDLEKTVVGQSIASVQVLGKTSIRHNPRFFENQLLNKEIERVGRRGKLLILDMSSDKSLLIHLKMTGQLIHVQKKQVLAGAWSVASLEKGLAFETIPESQNRLKASELPNAWTRVVLEFDNSSRLFFNDIRRFGYLQIVNVTQKREVLSRYGIEPLTDNYVLESFRDIFKKRTAPLKSILLNQQLIAGIGNIYADEICFQAGVRPTRKSHRLTRKEVEALFCAGDEVIREAVDFRGTSFRDYRDGSGEEGDFVSRLKVYGRDGEPCFTCQKPIKKIKFSGRGTHYCPYCQR